MLLILNEGAKSAIASPPRTPRHRNASWPPNDALGSTAVLPPKFDPTNPVTIQWLCIGPAIGAGARAGTDAGSALCAIAAPGSSAASTSVITYAYIHMTMGLTSSPRKSCGDV